MEVIRAGAEWKERIIAFADSVFGEKVQPGGFAELIPAVYGERAECDGNHLLVVEDGKIQALLLTEPTTFVCGEEKLSGIGVGTVSVAPDARGKGYMKVLLDAVHQRMPEKGYAFAVLSGQRQRYEYYGYEPAGIRVSAFYSPGSVKHALSAKGTKGIEAEISLAPMKEDGEDTDRAYELFCGRPVHTKRDRETFVLHMQAGRSRSFLVYRKGDFAGYLTASFRRGQVAVTELELVDESLLPAVCKVFSAQEAPEGFTLRASLSDRAKVMFLERTCSGYEIGSDHQYFMTDLRKVLAFSMKVKQQTVGLADGSWSFAVPEGVYHCEVRDGEISVTCSGHVPGEEGLSHIFTASQGEMVRLLFGPMGQYAWEGVSAPAGWLPFPLFLPESDAV